MTEWRVSSVGEKQWLGSDGNWYSTERLALATSGTQVTPSRRLRRRAYVLLGIIIALFGIIVAVVAWVVVSDLSGNNPYKVDQISVEHGDGSRTTDYVSFRIHNLGGSAFHPTCFVGINFVTGNGIGESQAAPLSPIDGHQYGYVKTAVTVTDKAAMSVTPSEVTVSC